MPLTRYADEAAGLAQDLVDELDFDEAEKLSRFLAVIGNDVWDEWRKLNHERVLRYIRSTPAQRGKLRMSPRIRGLTIFAAHLETLLAAQLIRAANRLQPGLSYRTTTAEAADEASNLVLAHGDWLWPWDCTAPWEHDTDFFVDRLDEFEPSSWI